MQVAFYSGDQLDNLILVHPPGLVTTGLGIGETSPSLFLASHSDIKPSTLRS